MLPLLLACAEPPDAPAAGLSAADLGGPLDVACAALPADRFAAPEPWATVDPAFEAYVDALAASPYRGGAGEHAVADLAAFDGALYAGLGDTDLNPGSRYCPADGVACGWEDAPGHGLPVVRFEPGARTTTWSHVVREEEVVFRRVGAHLLVPSLDPTEGDPPLDCEAEGADPACPGESGHAHERFQAGTFHAFGEGRWTESATIQTALHVYDLTVHEGRIFASGSSQPGPDDESGYATIWGSDDGVDWEVEYLDDDRAGTRRVTALLPFASGLVGLGYHAGREVQVRVVRVDGGWVPIEGLAPELEGVISAELLDEARALAWAGRHHAVITATEEGITAAALPWLGESGWVVDAWLLCAGDLLVLTRERTGPLDVSHVVYRTSDAESATELARWDAEEDLVSLAYWEETLVFGDREGRVWRAEPER